jgi:hypothetical protein
LFDGSRTARPTIIDAASGQLMSRSPRTMRADVAAAMPAMITDPSTVGKQMIVTSAQQPVDGRG